MSNKRFINLPLAGIDARQGLNVNPESVSEAVNVRAVEEDLRDYTYMDQYKPGPTLDAHMGRNLVQMFMSPPGGADRNRLIQLTSNGAYEFNNTTSAWTTLETGYAIGVLPIPGGGSALARFSVANTQHKLVWTMAPASSDIRVRIYDGTTVTPIAQNYSARHLIALNNRIVLADTMENGVRNSSRLRWCVNRNFQDWTGLGSGFLDVGSQNSSGRILALNNFGPHAILSLEREFIELVSTGSLFPVFQLGDHFSVPPVVAPRSWQTLNDVAFYLGPDSVYAWSRGQKSERIGKPIERLLAPYMVPERMDTIQSVLLAGRDEYRLLMTSGSFEGTPTAKVFIFDAKAGRWFVEELADLNVISKAIVIRQGNESFYCPVAPPGMMEYVIGTGVRDALYVEKLTNFLRSDPRPYFTTQDILAIDSQGAPDVNARNELINLYFRTQPGATVNVLYSTDRGTTYTTRSVTTNSEGLGIISCQVPFSTIRFRFQGTHIQTYPFTIAGPIMLEWDQIGTNY